MEEFIITKGRTLVEFNHTKRLSTQKFIEKGKLLHGKEKFDYSQTVYLNATTKLDIICKIHGIQTMLPHHHTNSKSYGCPQCGKEAINKHKQFTTETFIDKIKHIKGLSFEKTIYKSKREDVIITCDIHGDFTTKAEILLKGHGCRKCSSVNSRGEKEIESILDKNNIEYIRQVKFKGCIGVTNRPLFFDFYIPSLKACIEFDGKQHYKEVDYWGGKEGLEKRQVSDSLKNNYCKINNIPLLRIKYNDINIESIIENFLSSLKNNIIFV